MTPLFAGSNPATPANNKSHSFTGWLLLLMGVVPLLKLAPWALWFTHLSRSSKVEGRRACCSDAKCRYLRLWRTTNYHFIIFRTDVKFQVSGTGGPMRNPTMPFPKQQEITRTDLSSRFVGVVLKFEQLILLHNLDNLYFA